jgi:hypothetical protein
VGPRAERLLLTNCLIAGAKVSASLVSIPAVVHDPDPVSAISHLCSLFLHIVSYVRSQDSSVV